MLDNIAPCDGEQHLPGNSGAARETRAPKTRHLKAIRPGARGHATACEDAASDGEQHLPEWHFNQAAFDAELQEIRAEREKLAAEELAAKEQQARAEREAREEEEQLMQGAMQADAARVAEFSALRDRLAEVKDAADELFKGCDRQTEALGEQSNAARETRYEAEMALRTEATKVSSIMQQIQDLEQNHARLMQEKDNQSIQKRHATRRNIEQIHKQAERQSSQLESALQRELQIVYDTHFQVQGQLLKGMKDQWQGRQQALSACENDIRSVDRTVNTNLVSTHAKVLESEQKAHQQVMELQAQEFTMEDALSHKVQSAVAAMDEAIAAKHRSDNTQLDAVQRRQGATDALGKIFPRTTQMNLFGVKPGQSQLASKAWAVLGN